MRKTHSQDVALIFIIIDCLFMVPLIPLALISVPFLLFVGLLAFASLFTKDFIFGAVFFAVCFILLGVIGFGVHLMLGYFRHYKSSLTRKEIDRPWVKTIIYNSIFFFPAFYFKLQCRFTEKCVFENKYLFENNFFYELQLLKAYAIPFSFLILWWFLAIFLAFSALASIGESTYSNDSSR